MTATEVSPIGKDFRGAGSNPVSLTLPRNCEDYEQIHFLQGMNEYSEYDAAPVLDIPLRSLVVMRRRARLFHQTSIHQGVTHPWRLPYQGGVSLIESIFPLDCVWPWGSRMI